LLELSAEQQRVMDGAGNLLVLGGPGSGKTTIAILKAGKIVRDSLRPSQKVLFLSFARSTVARILEALDESESIERSDKRQLEVDTYHAFFWRLIRSHAYLLGFPRRLSILAPAAEAVALSSIRSEYPPQAKLTDAQRHEKEAREYAERIRLAREEGRVCFDLFGDLAAQILNGSQKIRELTSEAFPYVILDEFQDTNGPQWTVVKALAKRSVLIALADPEQRIYDFIGADPKRINHYIQECKPSKCDLSGANYRSPGTEIARFGNDLLVGQFTQSSYRGVQILTFPENPNQAYASLKGQVLQARRRLLATGEKSWSLALLVPTRRMTRLVSDHLGSSQSTMPAIEHSAAVDIEAVILASEIISFLLQPKADKADFESFTRLVCAFYEGRGGDTPTKTHLAESSRIAAALDKARQARSEGNKVNKNSLILPMLATYRAARSVQLTGDADADWVTVRRELENGPCKRLKSVAEEARNLRLLNRGTQLRSALSQLWRDSLAYPDALEVVRQAFVHEHFAKAWKPETGIVVMNMHKAKGKQFNEVVIFEGWPRRAKGKIVGNPDRIVRGNARDQADAQARQNFRVSVTRAKTCTTVLTPQSDRCVLLT
jgi:DNA helicase II / ATP-dependent DNA helicase PcrA